MIVVVIQQVAVGASCNQYHEAYRKMTCQIESGPSAQWDDFVVDTCSVVVVAEWVEPS